MRCKDRDEPGHEGIRVRLAAGEVAVAGDGVQRELRELACELCAVAQVVAQVYQYVGSHAPDGGEHAGGVPMGVREDGEDHVYAPHGEI